jgi:hypothetical protein
MGPVAGSLEAQDLGSGADVARPAPGRQDGGMLSSEAASAPDVPRRQGLADLDPPHLGREVLACWDAFLELVTAPSTDLTRPSRLRGWTGRDTCIHLGDWPDAPVLERLLASAEQGGTGPPTRPDDVNAVLVDAHRDASTAEVVEALHRSRAGLAAFFDSDAARRLGRAPARSAVGPLAVLTLVHAGCYELAVHGLDLAPCGAPAPPEHLLQRALAALLDITGALTSGAGVSMVLTGQTPTGGWRFRSDEHGWTTEPVGPGEFEGTGVRGTVVDLLDTSAGRSNLAQLVVTRRLQVQQMQHFMNLAPLLDAVPGLPGGPALRSAVGGLHGIGTGVGRLLGRLPGRR